MPQPKYQIFISSTFNDLKDERAMITRAVLELGHIPVGMEMFSADDEEQWKIIARLIDESDYYVVIAAHRYGTWVPDESIGWTEREYDYAISKKIPVYGFVIEDDADWPTDKVDKDAKSTRALKAFKAKVRLKPVNSWRNGQDLITRVSISLAKAFNAIPRPGYTRGPGLSPAMAAEVSRLSAENGALRQQIAESLAREKAAAVEAVRRRKLEQSGATRRAEATKLVTRLLNLEPIHQVLPLFDIFQCLGPALLASPLTAYEAAERLHKAKLVPWITYQDETEEYPRFSADVARGESHLADLFALDLISRATTDTWVLTDFGTECLKAIRLLVHETEKSRPVAAIGPRG